MVKPILFFIVALLFPFYSLLLAQTKQDCEQIKVNIRVENLAEASQAKGKILIDFSDGLDYKDFKLFLFADNRLDNKLDFTAEEVSDLHPGDYLLIVSGKDDEKYCSKQFKLTINQIKR